MRVPCNKPLLEIIQIVTYKKIQKKTSREHKENIELIKEHCAPINLKASLQKWNRCFAQ